MRLMLVPAAMVLAALAAPAAAQNVLVSPEGVRDCLCLRQASDFQAAQMTVARGAMEAAQSDLTRIQSEIARRRPLVDTNDAAALADFTKLLVEEEPARRALNDEKIPDYNAAVAAYSAATEKYNKQCAGKGLDPAAKAEAEANLVCPR
jgi:hypothetical protein